MRVPEKVLRRPYLHPAYDEPEFVVRNLWRLWGGWYDQNPAHLKPAPATAAVRDLVRTQIRGVGPDRVVSPELVAAEALIRSGAVIEAAQSAAGTLK